MIVQSCLLRRPTLRCLSSPSLPHTFPAVVVFPRQRQAFHASPRRHDDHGMPNHYQTLDVAANATHNDIKKQFYKLSKANHPDLHPNDPGASKRFVKISEAWAVLGSEEKKQRYDRDFFRSQQQQQHHNAPGAHHPSGSYSSAQSPAGGRPASGLSRRRTQFRGPPPSFFRNGGWGAQGEKRAENASKASHTHEAQGEAASGPNGPAGTGPGGFTAGFDNDVPHFDQRGHYQTHSTIEKMRHRARKAQEVSVDDLDYSGGSSMLFNFVMMSGVLGVIFAVSGALLGSGSKEKKAKAKEET